jgi:hypothetical protein
MVVFDQDEAVQRSGCAILCNLVSCPDSTYADLIGRAATVAAMTRFPTDVRIQFLGGKVLMATPPSETRHVALFGGPRALTRVMQVCGTNQVFQVTGCEKLGAFYDCQLASREGDASELGALYRKEAQRRGLGCSAALAALRGARKAFSKQDKSLGTFPELVVQLRAGNAKSVLQDVCLDLPREIRTENSDWADAFAGILGALEAFPKSEKVQQAGLVELRKWAETRVPNERRAAVTRPGPRVRKTGLLELNYKWTFGGIPQFPGPLVPGPGSSEGVAGDHLLLLRGLRVATSAAESFPFSQTVRTRLSQLWSTCCRWRSIWRATPNS